MKKYALVLIAFALVGVLVASGCTTIDKTTNISQNCIFSYGSFRLSPNACSASVVEIKADKTRYDCLCKNGYHSDAFTDNLGNIYDEYAKLTDVLCADCRSL